MKELMLTNFVRILIAMLSPELLQKLAAQLISFVETYVKGTASDVDDKIVLPLCDLVRGAFGITEK
jgi:hypothetical protein